MRKDVHVYIDYQLTNRIEKIARSHHMKISDIYAELLSKALDQEDRQTNFEIFNDNFNKLNFDINYIKKMLRIICSKLSIEFNDYESKRKMSD